MSSVYIVGASAEGPVKIGSSANPKSRLMGIQNGHPLRLSVLDSRGHDDAKRIETLTHRLLKAHRLVGEWFAVNLDAARQAIEGAIVAHASPPKHRVVVRQAPVPVPELKIAGPRSWRNSPTKFKSYIRTVETAEHELGRRMTRAEVNAMGRDGAFGSWWMP